MAAAVGRRKNYTTRLAQEAEELEREMVVLVVSPAPRRPRINRMIQLRSNQYLVVGILFVVVSLAVTIVNIAVTGSANQALNTETTPTQEQFAVVCQFLNVPNVTLCQTLIGTLTSIHVHNLWGTIPTEFGLLTQVTVVDLNGNQLNGTIPSALGNLVVIN